MRHPFRETERQRDRKRQRDRETERDRKRQKERERGSDYSQKCWFEARTVKRAESTPKQAV